MRNVNVFANTEIPMKCIYCPSTGKFNDEHVFPAGLGGDDRAFLLRGLVCEKCNSAFSRMEAGLMRNSLEAFARIHSQSRGRKRGKASSTPKFQPESITTFLPEGGDAEVELRAEGKVVLLPQFSLRENQIQCHGSDTFELKQFASSLQEILGEDCLYIVKKNTDADDVNYVVLTYRWDDVCYKEAETVVLKKPPKVCIWKDQRTNDNALGRPHRIYRRSGGQIVLRAGDMDTDNQFLTILRKNLPQLTNSASNARLGKSIYGAPIMVQMSANLIDRDRIFAKIGLNLCAFAFGESFVRRKCFDEIKSSILTAMPPITSRDIHLQGEDAQNTVVRMFLAAPSNHHLAMLTALQLPNGAITVGIAIRLYSGTVTYVTLTETAEFPIPDMPLFMLVDYQKHKIGLLCLNDFINNHLVP